MGKKFETIHEAHERIFGRTPRHTNWSSEGEVAIHIKNNSKPLSYKKEICPHCATKNFIKQDAWNGKCNKCGYER